MSTQPEALRLAASLAAHSLSRHGQTQAAAELRRLHDLNQELLEALKLIEHATAPTHDDGAYHENAHELARAAITKATGEQA